MRTSFVAFSVVCVAVVLTLSACRRDAVSADERPVVTVSIEPLRYLTEQLAAGRFRVVTMVPRGSSPENYEPSPQQLVDLADSRAYFRVGTLGFERTWMAKFVDNAPDLKVYDTSAGIAPVRSGHRHDGQAVDDTDPHTWMSPENVRLIARHICQALCELDSADASLYRRRLDSLNCRIDSVDSVVRHELAALRHRTFLTYHPALGHFARDYGLRQLSVESEGREPSPVQLRRLVRKCRSAQVKVVFVQEGLSGTAARQVAREIGARVVTINPLAYDWPAEITGIARHLSDEP